MSEEKAKLAAAVVDAVRRTALHYGMWFSKAADRFGIDAALAMEKEAGDQATQIVIDRLCRTLDVEQKDGLPAPLAALDADKLQELLTALAVNWLALDGVWFQAVERRQGLTEAKQVNDACWAFFSPLEAARIKDAAGLPEAGGLEALAKTFADRLYGAINRQEVFFDTDGSLVMRMNMCRVQAARQRKGLPDYPCKSGGVVEYTTFAKTIDRRIRCECIACPPDPRPEDWFCAWRFTVAEEAGAS